MGNIDCAKILSENELSAVSGGNSRWTFDYYTVQPGETLTQIAKKFNTTVAKIKRDNPQITNEHHIEAGWVLRFPRQID